MSCGYRGEGRTAREGDRSGKIFYSTRICMEKKKSSALAGWPIENRAPGSGGVGWGNARGKNYSEHGAKFQWARRWRALNEGPGNSKSPGQLSQVNHTATTVSPGRSRQHSQTAHGLERPFQQWLDFWGKSDDVVAAAGNSPGQLGQANCGATTDGHSGLKLRPQPSHGLYSLPLDCWSRFDGGTVLGADARAT